MPPQQPRIREIHVPGPFVYLANWQSMQKVPGNPQLIHLVEPMEISRQRIKGQSQISNPHRMSAGGIETGEISKRIASEVKQ